MAPNVYTFEDVETTKEDGVEKVLHVLKNQLGYFTEPEEAVETLMKALEFYDLRGADGWIREQNTRIFLDRHFPYDPEKGLYTLEEATIEMQEAHEVHDHNWHFTCRWCGDKWKSSDWDVYYVASVFEGDEYEINLPASGAIVCSGPCGWSLIEAAQKEYLLERRLLEHFDVY